MSRQPLPFENYVGHKFGRLRVTGCHRPPGTGTMYACACDCGQKVMKRASSVFQGAIKSCGCFQRDRMTTHGGSCSREYRSRTNAITTARRTGVPFHPAWQDHEQFMSDLGPPPAGSYCLHRVDPAAGYVPGNCRWHLGHPGAPGAGRRSRRFLTIDGQTKGLAEWSKLTGIALGLIVYRVNAGWSAERALTTKTKKE